MTDNYELVGSIRSCSRCKKDLNLQSCGPQHDLEWTAEHWEDLVEYRLKGTPRPWRQAGDMNPEQRSTRDALARVEIAEADRLGRAPGFSPAPMHVSTFDVMVDILAEADALHETIAQRLGHDRLETARSAYDSAERFLWWCAARVELSAEDAPLYELVVEKAALMRSAMSTELGIVVDGQVLNAVCPFCCGVTPRTPGGGAKTLRFRMVPSRVHEGDEEAMIVCESTCQPFDREVDTWHRGRPAWPWSQWEWLAERLLPAS
jgi:hypothetical protein